MNRAPGRGFALIIVLVAIAVMSLVIGAFAARIDSLREQTANFSAYARARVQAGNAAAAGLYWVTTRSGGPAGYGGPGALPGLRADGRPYRVDDGLVRMQDLRGLYPLNDIDRDSLARLLRSLGAAQGSIDGHIDVLLDYTDTDRLKRLNGAEAADYAALGLPPPRDDYLLSTRELARMPLWRDAQPLVDAMDVLGGVNRSAVINPNTAQRSVLQSFLPTASAQQLELLETLRQQLPFDSSQSAQRLTGISMPEGRFVFHTGEQLRLIAWAPGLPQAVQYNLVLLPGGVEAPWLITEVHTIPAPQTRDTYDSAAPFPLVIAPARP